MNVRPRHFTFCSRARLAWILPSPDAAPHCRDPRSFRLTRAPFIGAAKLAKQRLDLEAELRCSRKRFARFSVDLQPFN